MRFQNKVALITGSSSGIGADAAINMAKEGASVIVNYRENKPGAEETAQKIRGCGAKVLVCQADIRKEEDVRKMVDAAVKEFGRIDILVNNAGVFNNDPFLETTTEVFKDILDTNVIGTFLVCKYVIPEMLKKSKGIIVNISSGSGILANEAGIPYVCSKHGVVAINRRICSEFGPQGIRSNAVCPGIINTRMVAAALDDPRFMAGMRKTPAGRAGEVSDTTNLILFLASDQSDFIHGETIAIDGGYITARTTFSV